MPKAIRQLVGTTRSELLITNAYIIPDDDAVAELKALGSRGAKVRVLTNSLSSHDVPAVNSHYKAWRRRKLEARRAARGGNANSNRFVVPVASIEAEFAEAGFTILGHHDFLPGYAMWRVYTLRKQA